MAVSREVTINYSGVDYKFIPRNSFLRSIEDVVPIVPYLGRAGREPHASHTAFIMAMIAGQSGSFLDEDDVYSDLINDLASNNGKMYFSLFGQISDAFVPPSAAKNSSPSEQPKPGDKEQKETKKA